MASVRTWIGIVYAQHHLRRGVEEVGRMGEEVDHHPLHPPQAARTLRSLGVGLGPGLGCSYFALLVVLTSGFQTGIST